MRLRSLWISSDRIHCATPIVCVHWSGSGFGNRSVWETEIRYDSVMRHTFFSFAIATLSVACLAVSSAAHAQSSQGQPGGQGPQPPGQQSGERSRPAFPRQDPRNDNGHNSLSDSVRRVQREPGVRVLSAERVPFDGRDINRIKYVDERGRVRYMDDAGSTRRRSAPRTEQAPPAGQSPPPARGDNPSEP